MARGIQERFTLIRRLGYRLYPSGKSLLDASPVMAVGGATVLHIAQQLLPRANCHGRERIWGRCRRACGERVFSTTPCFSAQDPGNEANRLRLLT
jgi:hypothetical protein